MSLIATQFLISSGPQVHTAVRIAVLLDLAHPNASCQCVQAPSVVVIPLIALTQVKACQLSGWRQGVPQVQGCRFWGAGCRALESQVNKENKREDNISIFYSWT